MRHVRPRFRLRRLLLATAIFLCASLFVFSRHVEFSLASERYGDFADGYQSSDPFEDRGFMTCYGEAWDNYATNVVERDIRAHARDRAYRDRRAAYYRKLQLKYQHAARYPWLPLSSGPPASR